MSSSKDTNIPPNESKTPNGSANNSESKDESINKNDAIENGAINNTTSTKAAKNTSNDKNITGTVSKLQNESDTISTGSAGSLLYSSTGSNSSSSLCTYEDLIISDDASVYVEMTRDIASDITTSISDAVGGSNSPNLLTNLRGNILANLAVWASTHMKSSTDMEPLADKQKIEDLVNLLKHSVAKKLERQKSQVRFNETGIKILDCDQGTDIQPSGPETINVTIKEKTVETKHSEVETVSEKNIIWYIISLVKNVFKDLFFIGCKHDTKNVDNNDKLEVKNDSHAFGNPVAGTSKDPVPLLELGKSRLSTSSSKLMITIKPRRERPSLDATSESSHSKKDGAEIPKSPRPPGKKKIRSKITEIKEPSELQMASLKGKCRPTSSTLDSKANLAIASSIIEAGLKRSRNCIGLTQLIQNNVFNDPANVKELFNLLTGLRAQKDWARDGKFLFHYTEDVRTFGTLLAQIVGGCILNGTVIPQENKLSLRNTKTSALSLKTDPETDENELLTGYLRGLEMKDGIDSFARGFQDGIHSFSPGIRRY